MGWLVVLEVDKASAAACWDGAEAADQHSEAYARTVFWIVFPVLVFGNIAYPTRHPPAEYV